MAYESNPNKKQRHRYETLGGQFGMIDADFEDMPMERPLTGRSVDKYPELPDGENTKYLAVIIETEKIRAQANINDIDSLYNCLNLYLQLIQKYDTKLTNMGVYRACGVTKEMIDAWAAGRQKKHKPEYAEFALNVRGICSSYREIIMSEGKLNPITGIWWQKNYDRFEDKPVPYITQDVENEELTSAEIAEKYSDLPDE